VIAWRTVSEMTYNVSIGTLNLTHSLTHFNPWTPLGEFRPPRLPTSAPWRRRWRMRDAVCIITSCHWTSCLTAAAAAAPAAAAAADDYCQWEKFTAACDSVADELIVMESARYGRMQLGRCIKYDLGFIGCSADALALADSLCSGRRRCEIALPNEAFDRINPCLSELKSYLTASYSCVRGLYAD